MKNIDAKSGRKVNVDYLSMVKSSKKNKRDSKTYSIREDPHMRRILDRMPKNVRETFNDDQLLAIKTALGAHKWLGHKWDIRGTLRIWRSHYYYVFVAGRDRRALSRAEQELSRKARVYSYGLVLWFFFMLGFFLLYLLKAVFHINLFPGYSLGILDWIKNSF